MKKNLNLHIIRKKQKHAAHDLMFKFRQSKVTLESNPEVTDVETKVTARQTLQYKKLAWINNGITKLNMTDRVII